MRKALSWLALAALLALAGSFLLGYLLSAPMQRTIGLAPADLNATDVEFGGVKGWFVSAATGAPCVLLMHGVRADRRSMIERARMLKHAGYSSLLFDFQAHGESPGPHITFGHLESISAHAAVDLLRSRLGCPRVAAIGVSLGGAASLLGANPIDVDALVLESVYPSFEAAVANRLRIRLGAAGAQLAPLLTWQIKPLLGIDSSALQPVQRIGAYHRPLLILSGSEDLHQLREQDCLGALVPQQ
jgi:pimeloyl-ACP methyl ester carboxylesterase